MAHKDPFTFDLFSNTSISSGLGLGVAAFPTTLEADNTDHPQSSLVLAPARSFASVPSKAARPMGENFHLADNRELAKTWRDRARDNLAAIRLAAEIEAEQRPATADEQTALIRFTGFGASELANGVFRRPGEEAFRKGWEAIGGELEGLVDAAAYASLARCTSTPITRRNISSAWSGPVCSGSGFAAAACSNPDRQRPVPGFDAGGTARRLSRHRRRTRSAHRPDRETAPAACDDSQPGFRTGGSQAAF
jgi:hypothetical protein